MGLNHSTKSGTTGGLPLPTSARMTRGFRNPGDHSSLKLMPVPPLTTLPPGDAARSPDLLITIAAD